MITISDKQINVFITDDNSDFIDILKDCFEMYPFINIIGTAQDGASCLQQVMKSQNRIDVLLLDLIMPELDGLEVLKQIHNLENKPKVLVVTAMGSDRIRNTALELGADNIIVKPFDIDSLIGKILNMHGAS